MLKKSTSLYEEASLKDMHKEPSTAIISLPVSKNPNYKIRVIVFSAIISTNKYLKICCSSESNDLQMAPFIQDFTPCIFGFTVIHTSDKNLKSWK